VQDTCEGEVGTLAFRERERGFKRKTKCTQQCLRSAANSSMCGSATALDGRRRLRAEPKNGPRRCGGRRPGENGRLSTNHGPAEAADAWCAGEAGVSRSRLAFNQGPIRTAAGRYALLQLFATRRMASDRERETKAGKTDRRRRRRRPTACSRAVATVLIDHSFDSHMFRLTALKRS